MAGRWPCVHLCYHRRGTCRVSCRSPVYTNVCLAVGARSLSFIHAAELPTVCPPFLLPHSLCYVQWTESPEEALEVSIWLNDK